MKKKKLITAKQREERAARLRERLKADTLKTKEAVIAKLEKAEQGE